jgi:hypothetical protein
MQGDAELVANPPRRQTANVQLRSGLTFFYTYYLFAVARRISPR